MLVQVPFTGSYLDGGLGAELSDHENSALGGRQAIDGIVERLESLRRGHCIDLRR